MSDKRPSRNAASKALEQAERKSVSADKGHGSVFLTLQLNKRLFGRGLWWGGHQ